MASYIFDGETFSLLEDLVKRKKTRKDVHRRKLQNTHKGCYRIIIKLIRNFVLTYRTFDLKWHRRFLRLVDFEPRQIMLQIII